MFVSIILAAGEGTRMKSKVTKVLHKVCGKEIFKYVYEATKKAKIEKNIVVLSASSIESVKNSFSDESLVFVEQEKGENKPYGTGYAVMCAVDEIKDEDTVVILCGDGPLVKSETIENLIAVHEKNSNAATVLTCIVNQPHGLGRIVRNNKNLVEKIVEEKDANEVEKTINEINTGVYAFKGKMLKDSLKKIDTNNASGEYYLTDTLKVLNEDKYNIGACILEDETEMHAVNNRIQLADVTKLMRKRVNEKHMLAGVTLIDPESTYIESDVVIGKDTIIEPNTYLEGNTVIGEDCVIGPNSRIINTKIGDRTSIDSSKTIDAVVGDETTVGPFAYLRPKAKLGNNCKIGDFVEVKNAVLGNGSKSSHLAYIGDAEVGEKVNIGCGVVFVNYDGKNKNKTIIKDGAFVGSNSNLIAPVTIEKEGYVACGSTITDNVGEGDLAIARARQVNKEGRGKGRF